MTPLLLPTPDTDAEFARITAALTRRGFLGGSAAALSMLALAGRSSGEGGDGPDGATRTVQTHYGSVDVPVDPQRIVAVSYNTPWQLQAVGAQPVATLDYSAYIDQFTPTQQKFIEGLSTVGVFLEVNREAVVAAAPDLIVGDAYEIDEDMFRELSKIAPTAVYSGTNRSDWRSVSEGVADAVNKGSALTSNREKYTAMQERIRTDYAAQLGDNRWAHPNACAGSGRRKSRRRDPTASRGCHRRARSSRGRRRRSAARLRTWCRRTSRACPWRGRRTSSVPRACATPRCRHRIPLAGPGRRISAR